MRIILTYIMVGILAVSCSQKTTQGNEFGESFTSENVISVSQLVNQLDGKEQLEGVVVKGTVEEVCKVKGCWMTLKVANNETMRVTFKDYGFFVPKDIHGVEVIVKGTGQIETTSVDDLRHFAEDEGLTKEEIDAITEPLDEYTFIADGVKIN